MRRISRALLVGLLLAVGVQVASGQYVVQEVARNETHSHDKVQVHVVRPGESLDAIAENHGMTLDAVMGANGITDPAVVYAGTALRLRGQSFVAGGTQGQSVHSVAAGESLSGIAVRYGTTVSQLVSANHLHDADRIFVGQALSVPSVGWVCPVPGAKYFNDWGFPRNGGRFHEGNDLFAQRGSPVLAPVAGDVEQVTGSFGGHQFRLFGVDGVTYFGSHMEAFGQAGRVQAGTVIGYVGDSGNAKGSRPHLHFEMHPAGGSAANPHPTLQRFGC